MKARKTGEECQVSPPQPQPVVLRFLPRGQQWKFTKAGLCEKIEAETPTEDAEVYKLTHAATEEFNDLAEEFEENESEIETGARDTIGVDIANIAEAYGFDLDGEELIAPRDW